MKIYKNVHRIMLHASFSVIFVLSWFLANFIKFEKKTLVTYYSTLNKLENRVF